MRSSIFTKLAVTNLKNNRKTYVPYIFTAILTVMMYYIINDLSGNPDVTALSESLRYMMKYATNVVAVFAVIFLFYTNSFLIKRRKREIGVYNILGMGKGHIASMLIVETLITAVTCIGGGLVFGVIFSKLMFLILLKILHYDIQMGFSVSSHSIIVTLILFTAIFSMTLIYNLIQIKITNPVVLLRGGSQGEKEPKTKWTLTIFGVIMIGIGYYIALSTESPLNALGMFFVAVICVILGTYALFIAGSIALLKMLRKNKIYYYQTKHFTAISGMIYRMKQNAVGLANICILSTMVLVMVSTTVSLYAGMEDVLDTRFPKDFLVTSRPASTETEQQIERIIEEEAKGNAVDTVNQMGCRYASFSTYVKKNQFSLMQAGNYSSTEMSELYLIPQEDYNRIEETNIELAENEVLLFYNGKEAFNKKTIQLGNDEYSVKRELDTMENVQKKTSQVMQAYYLVMRDTEQIQKYLDQVYQTEEMNEVWKARYGVIRYEYSFDLKGTKDNTIQAMKAMQNRIAKEVPGAECEIKELSRESFYSLYGGLLFIGIYLGCIFLMATVLIIYYKQISEGYDDRERYQIMQKVGMSKKEVKKSIQSQILTVFFLPIATAVIHIAVAFRIITKLLAVLNLVNVPLFLVCTIVTVAVFAVFYAIVYTLTAREYYRIVN